MENELIFGNWIISTEKDLNKNGVRCWVRVGYKQKAPTSFDDDVFPDWGIYATGHSIEGAARKLINGIWNDPERGSNRITAELISALVMAGIIQSNFRVSDESAVIDGVWYFGYSDGITHGIKQWNAPFCSDAIAHFDFSRAGNKLAKAITIEASKDIHVNPDTDFAIFTERR